MVYSMILAPILICALVFCILPYQCNSATVYANQDISLLQNSTGFLFSVRGNDTDSALRYQFFMSPYTFLQMDAYTGDISLQSGSGLDLAQSTTMNFKVNVINGLLTPGNSIVRQINVTINILPVTYGPIIITRTFGNLPTVIKRVLYNQQATSAYSLVYQINATQANNSLFTYGFVPGREGDAEGCFTVNSQTGIVMTTCSTWTARIYTLSLRVATGSTIISTLPYQDLKLLVYTYFIGPQFAQDINVIDFKEGTSPGLVGKLPAEPLNNIKDNITVTTFVSPDFNMNVNGEISSRNTMDYEGLLIREWEIIAIAFENGSAAGGAATSTGLIRINLVDVNDNPPYFGQLVYNASQVFMENVVINTLIATIPVMDKDTLPQNRNFNFTVDNPLFNVTKDPVTNAALVYTAESLLSTSPNPAPIVYSTVLTAKDGFGSATATVQVYLLPVNKFPPQFTSSNYQITASNEIINRPIFHAIATDKDNSAISYYFDSDGNGTLALRLNSLFVIVNSTGDIAITDSTIKPGTYTLLLRAVDDGFCFGCVSVGPRLMSNVTTVTLTVFSINRFKPFFINCPVSVNVSENMPVGTPILFSVATDRDPFTYLTYSLISNEVVSNPFQYLSINSTSGQIVTSSVIDRESIGPSVLNTFDFTVQVQDSGTPSLVNFCTFKLNVLDVNDNAPIFYDNGLTAVLPANTTLSNYYVNQLYAFDRDLIGTNFFIVVYTLVSWSGPGTISVNLNSGVVLFSGSAPTNSGPLTAIFQGNNPGNTNTSLMTNFTMRIYFRTDPNKIPPIISPTSININISILENTTVQSNILSTPLTASIPLGTFSNYSFLWSCVVGGSDETNLAQSYFTVRSSIGLSTNIYLKQTIAYYNTKEFFLRFRASLLASDAVIGDIYSDMFVHVIVIDVNDQQPVFLNRQQYFVIGMPEDTAAYTPISYLFGFDKDMTPPPFYTLNFEFYPTSGYQNLFSINNSILYTSQGGFDYDNGLREYYLVLDARDSAPSSFSSVFPDNNKAGATKITVQLTDINDNFPSFTTPPLSLAIKDDIEIGTPIGQVSATDADQFDIILYDLWDLQLGKFTDDFYIDPFNGTIYTAKYLFAFIRSYYPLWAVAFDGVHYTNLSVNINVSLVNFFSPYLDPTKALFNYTENASPGFVGQINASDQDSATFDYFLLWPKDGTFSIDQKSGSIYSQVVLDRDPPNGVPSWNLTIAIHDHNGFPDDLIGYANVVVNVNDVNDNGPLFPVDSLHHSLLKGTPVGQVFSTISGLDVDAPPNNVILYTEVNPSPYITVNSNGGISAKTALTYDSLPKQYTIVVNATNPGYNGFTTATVTVTVVNAITSNVALQFNQSSYTVSVSETIAVGSQFFTVKANDLGADLTYSLDYSLISPSNNFDIVNLPEVKSGAIRVKNALNFESATGPYSLTILASMSNPTLSSTCTVTISVVNVVDEKPRINLNRNNASVFENVQNNPTLTTFSVTSNEANSQARTYTLSIDNSTNPNSVFGLKNVLSASADLFVSGVLDRESLTNDSSVNPVVQRVVLLAVDSAAPLSSASATFTVSIYDTNDNTPTISTVVTIPEGAAVGTFGSPGEIYAQDIDFNGFSPFSYTINTTANTSWNGNFELSTGYNSTNSVLYMSIKTLKVFQQDQNGLTFPYNFYLPVIITDISLNSTTSTVTVSIQRSRFVNSFKQTEVFIGQNWYYFYGNTSNSLDIGYVDDDENPSSRNSKTYVYTNPAASRYSVTMDSTGFVRLLPNCSGGNFTVNAQVTMGGNSVTALMDIILHPATYEAIQNAISVRIVGMTASQYVYRAPYIGATQIRHVLPSYSDKMEAAIAALVPTPEQYVDTISIKPVPNSNTIDVYIAAHGSPYYYLSRILQLIQANLASFNALLAPGYISMVPIDSCKGDNSLCPGGCKNVLDIALVPTRVSSPGSSQIGVDMISRSSCNCIAPQKSAPPGCSFNSCYNGGTCSVINGSQAFTCSCPSGYEGPRCQGLQIGFTSYGYALFNPIGSCSYYKISFNFITTTSGPALLFYSGPLLITTPTVDAKDFLSIELNANSQLLVRVELGNGIAEGFINKAVNDNQWHRVDVYLNNGILLMTVDECGKDPVVLNGSPLSGNMSVCFVKFPVPGPATQLNVDSFPLQLGGRIEQQTAGTFYPSTLTTNGFIGVIRELRVNDELYNLYAGTRGQSKNAQQVPTSISQSCNKADGTPFCNQGTCWGVINGAAATGTCDCFGGWRKDSSGSCTVAVNSKFLENNSYIILRKKPTTANIDDRRFQIEFMFRTRQTDGTLLLIRSFWPYYMRPGRIEFILRQSMLTASIDFGNFSSIPFTLPNSNVCDGAWHKIRLRRTLSAVELSMDEGDRNNYLYVNLNPDQLFNHIALGDDIFLGARLNQDKLQAPLVIEAGTNAVQTCLKDVRVNSGWYTLYANEQTDAISMGTVPASVNANLQCPDLDVCAPGASCTSNLICVPSWRVTPNACGCPVTSVLFAGTCYLMNSCIDNPCLNGGLCNNLYNTATCTCVGAFTGPTCAIPLTIVATTTGAPSDVASAGLAGGFIALIVLLILLLLILLLIFLICFCCRKRGTPLLPPDEYIREGVKATDEGAGEVDTFEFDLGKLDLPDYIPIAPVTIKPLAQSVPPPSTAPQDEKSPPYDYTLDYGYEGTNSYLGDDLSSLVSGSSDASQAMDPLPQWGPPFKPLADLYRPHNS